MIGFIINIMKEGMRMNQDNILVVEDEIEIAKAIEIYLKSQGYNVYKVIMYILLITGKLV